jgi:hypothetical protein
MATYRDLVQSYVNSTGAELEIKSMISSRKVAFPAFLTNISQDFKSSWNSEDVFGRMDPIASFQNTKRTVALSFNVPAASVAEAKENQTKFSKFSQMLYPAYLKSAEVFTGEAGNSVVTSFDTFDAVSGETTTTSNFASSNVRTMAKAPLLRVKFGNLVRSQDGTEGLLGYIDGISFKPTLSLGMFAEGGGNFYAKNFELSFTLSVLHDSDLGVDANTGDWLGPQDNFPF